MPYKNFVFMVEQATGNFRPETGDDGDRLVNLAQAWYVKPGDIAEVGRKCAKGGFSLCIRCRDRGCDGLGLPVASAD